MTRALRFPFQLAILLAIGFLVLGAEIQCAQANARPTLSGLQTQLDDVEARVTAIEEVVEFPPICPAQDRGDDSDIARDCVVDIPDAAEASRNIREIAIDELSIDAREYTPDVDGYRTYGPGQAHWGSAKFTSAVTLGGSKELQAWWQEAAKGQNIRKSISVICRDRDLEEVRRYNLLDCFPTRLSPLPSDSCSGEQQEELAVTCDGILFESAESSDDPAGTPAGGEQPASDGVVANAEAGTSDKFAQVRGFKVEISGASGKEVDTAWESVSGGELIIELTETTIGGDKFRTTSPGHKTVNEITLRGAMTRDRKALLTWINDTIAGREWKRSLTITELLSVDGAVKDGKQYVCQDAFPIRYVFPRMSAANTTGNVMEEVSVKPIRCELK